MGDDLYIAREFSNAALADISAMDAMHAAQNPANFEQMSETLARLQDGAKRLRARAIYQSAQRVIDGLAPSAVSQDGFNTRLSALSHLVSQYASGLSEVEAALANEQTDDAEIAAAPPAKKITVKTAPQPSHEELNLRARAVLTDTIGLARAGEITPLQALLDYDPHKAPVDNAPIEITPETPDVTPAVQSKPQPQIPLEYVLRDAIQDALSIARMSGKTISISYDVGQTHIGQNHTASVERRLCEGLRALILQSLPQNGIGHIDVNLRGNNMVIHSKHDAPRLLPNDISSRKVKNGCEMTFDLQAKETAKGHTQISEMPAAQNTDTQDTDTQGTGIKSMAAPMITAETEDQLRAQLSALLDSQDTAQTRHHAQSHDGLHLEDNIIVMTDEAAKKDKHNKNNVGEMGASL